MHNITKSQKQQIDKTKSIKLKGKEFMLTYSGQQKLAKKFKMPVIKLKV